jgi:hypothetical protein
MSYTLQELREEMRTGGAWVAPTLLNSWVNYLTGYSPAGYRIIPGGNVQLRGLVKSGTNGHIFTLPEDLWPSGDHIFTAHTSPNGTSARLDVRATGVVFATGYSASWFSLSHIIYPING